MLQQLTEKAVPKGDVLVILDACHSGTATRGMESCRGTEVKFEEPEYLPKPGKGEKMNYLNTNSTSLSLAQTMSPMLIISGSGKLELNYENYDKDNKTYV